MKRTEDIYPHCAKTLILNPEMGNTPGKEIFARRPVGWGHSLCRGALLCIHPVGDEERAGTISPPCPCSRGF